MLPTCYRPTTYAPTEARCDVVKFTLLPRACGNAVCNPKTKWPLAKLNLIPATSNAPSGDDRPKLLDSPWTRIRSSPAMLRLDSGSSYWYKRHAFRPLRSPWLAKDRSLFTARSNSPDMPIDKPFKRLISQLEDEKRQLSRAGKESDFVSHCAKLITATASAKREKYQTQIAG